jgi:hypothetical protein
MRRAREIRGAREDRGACVAGDNHKGMMEVVMMPRVGIGRVGILRVDVGAAPVILWEGGREGGREGGKGKKRSGECAWEG